jgi:hypothetical protein
MTDQQWTMNQQQMFKSQKIATTSVHVGIQTDRMQASGCDMTLENLRQHSSDIAHDMKV